VFEGIVGFGLAPFRMLPRSGLVSSITRGPESLGVLSLGLVVVVLGDEGAENGLAELLLTEFPVAVGVHGIEDREELLLTQALLVRDLQLAHELLELVEVYCAVLVHVGDGHPLLRVLLRLVLGHLLVVFELGVDGGDQLILLLLELLQLVL